MERLILFDIDGTLTRTVDGYIPFNEALFETFGVECDIRTVVPDGNTDPLIVRDIFAKANHACEVDDAGWRRFTINLRARYHQHVLNATTTIKPLPGAAELLRRLAAGKVFCPSVVTGNFEVTAEIKLEAAGLAPYLCRGAYASDSPRRSDLPEIARRRREEMVGQRLRPEHCIIIGDTPKDLDAARENQMRCVLVGTGRYPIEELKYFEPDGCLADLTDTEAVLSMLAQV